MKTYLSENLSIHSDLEVKVSGEWVSWDVFKKGKHKEEINKWYEEISCNTIDSNHTKLLVLSEALGTDIRHVDCIAGVTYIVHFQRGKQTRLSIYRSGNEIYGRNGAIKVLSRGAVINEKFECELAHILNI